MDTFGQQEYYVLELIRIVLPDRQFEVTTAPVSLHGNEVRGIKTLDIYALLNATPEQQAAAHAAVVAEIERGRVWHEQRRAAELAEKRQRGYSY